MTTKTTALSPDEVRERMEEAALTLRRVPNPSASGARGYGSSWPEYVREAKHAYGYEEARVRVIPNAREIARMDEAIEWLRLVADPDDRRIVWMRADGYRWRAVCSRVGLSRSQAWRRWTAALLTISRRLGRRQTGKGRAGRAEPKPGRGSAQPTGSGAGAGAPQDALPLEARPGQTGKGGAGARTNREGACRPRGT